MRVFEVFEEQEVGTCRFESPFSPSLTRLVAMRFALSCHRSLSLYLSYRRRHRPGLVRNRVPGHAVEEDAPPRGSGAEAAKILISSFNRREEVGDVHQSPRRRLRGPRARRREGSDRDHD